MTIEQDFYNHLRERGYWDCFEQLKPNGLTDLSELAWSNPNHAVDPDMMFKLVWLLGSSSRRQRLSPIDLRILDQTASDLVRAQPPLPATESYVKYLYEQVYSQEYPMNYPAAFDGRGF